MEEGEDLVTLVTCTPYGINTHRLLVRGRRVAVTEKPIRGNASQVTFLAGEIASKSLVHGAMIVLMILLLICLIVIIRIKKAAGRKKK